MNHIRILVHASGSSNDAHLEESIPKAIQMAKARNLTVEPVQRLGEIKERLLLPAHDPQAGDAALSADSTVKIIAGLVRHLDPVVLRNPATGKREEIKPPLAAVLPTAKTRYPFVLADAGAHVANTGFQIAAGALLCGSFWRMANNTTHPRYGVLGYGEEESKLPEELRMAYQLLRQETKRTVKIVEPKEILAGDSAEILVPRNGEIGNIFLKTAEATLAAFGTVVREEIRAEFRTTVGGVLARPALQRAKERFYNREVHGAFFLGIKKPVMKHHGRMGADELFLAIERLALYATKDVILQTRVDFLEQLEGKHPDWLPR